MTSPYPENENWPATWEGSRLTGKFLDAGGNPIEGSITFKPTATAVFDTTTDVIILPEPITVELDENGEFDVWLPATDDADINPSDWTYRVVERFEHGRKYYIEAPAGETRDLTNVAPVPSSTGNAVVVGPAGPSAVSEDEGNVLTLGTDGFVYVDAQDLGGGVSDHGLLTGLADDDHTQYHNDTRGDARYYTKTAADTLLAAKAASVHTHDDRYYTETEVDTLLTGKADDADITSLDTRVDELESFAAIRAVQGTQPSTTGWATNDFWYDTSTE